MVFMSGNLDLVTMITADTCALDIYMFPIPIMAIIVRRGFLVVAVIFRGLSMNESVLFVPI